MDFDQSPSSGKSVSLAQQKDKIMDQVRQEMAVAAINDLVSVRNNNFDHREMNFIFKTI